MKIKLLVGALIFLIVINLVTIGTFIYLQFNEKEEGRFKFRSQDSLMIPPFLHPDEIGEKLTIEQKEKLFGLFNNFRKESEDTQLKIQEVQDELIEILRSETFNEDEVNEQLNEIAQLRLEISIKAVSNLKKAKSFLSPEQFENFLHAIMQFRPMMHPRMGPPFRNGPPFPFGREKRDKLNRKNFR